MHITDDEETLVMLTKNLHIKICMWFKNDASFPNPFVSQLLGWKQRVMEDLIRKQSLEKKNKSIPLQETLGKRSYYVQICICGYPTSGKQIEHSKGWHTIFQEIG